jgi:hypothetical protein
MISTAAWLYSAGTCLPAGLLKPISEQKAENTFVAQPFCPGPYAIQKVV